MVDDYRVSAESIAEFKKVVMDMHESIINVSTGEHGVRDDGGLEHALYEILMAIYKHDKNPFFVASKIYKLISERHYFVDGNKRTAHILAKSYLLISGYNLKPYRDAIEFIRQISRGEKTIKDVVDWMKNNSTIIADSLSKYDEEMSAEFNEMIKWSKSEDS